MNLQILYESTCLTILRYWRQLDKKGEATKKAGGPHEPTRLESHELKVSLRTGAEGEWISARRGQLLTRRASAVRRATVGVAKILARATNAHGALHAQASAIAVAVHGNRARWKTGGGGVGQNVTGLSACAVLRQHVTGRRDGAQQLVGGLAIGSRNADALAARSAIRTRVAHFPARLSSALVGNTQQAFSAGVLWGSPISLARLSFCGCAGCKTSASHPAVGERTVRAFVIRVGAVLLDGVALALEALDGCGLWIWVCHHARFTGGASCLRDWIASTRATSRAAATSAASGTRDTRLGARVTHAPSGRTVGAGESARATRRIATAGRRRHTRTCRVTATGAVRWSTRATASATSARRVDALVGAGAARFGAGHAVDTGHTLHAAGGARHAG